MNIRKFALLSLLASGALLTGAAQARDDVQWSVTLGNGVGAPVYGAPVYVPAPARVVYPAPVVVHQGWRPTRWDVDGDGVPNHRDPVDNRHRYRSHGYDRDRDGIPDHRDRVDNRRFDRDRDGVPDRWDRRDDRRDDRYDGHNGWRR